MRIKKPRIMRSIDLFLAKIANMTLPPKRKELIKKRLFQAGYKEIPHKKIEALFILTVIITFFAYVRLLFSTGILSFGITYVLLSFVVFMIFGEIFVFIAAFLMARLYLNIKIYNRAQSIEKNLPVFLRELSTNLKAGREFVSALEDSVSEEFGPLYEDISYAVIQIRSGEPIGNVLRNYSNKYDSYTIKETFEIILDAYNGGGGLSEIIDKIAENLEVIHFLKKNAIANVSNYIIFMSIVSIFLAPILFALSFNLLWLIETLLKRLILGGSSSYLPDFVRSVRINFDDFSLFSRISVGVISGSAAAIIGIIRKGSLKGSSILILFYISLSIFLYQLSLVILQKLFQFLFAFT